MRILYDYQAFANVVSGASRSYCKVGGILSNDHEIIWGSKRSNNQYLRQIHPRLKTFCTHINFRGKTRIHKHLEQQYSAGLIRADKFDIMFATGEDLYYTDMIKRPFVTTIHDMVPENYTRDDQRIAKRVVLVEKATRIVTVSHHTKSELIASYPEIDINKIDVVYHGFEKVNLVSGSNQWGDYLLFVGQRQSYKNFDSFMITVSPLLSRNSNLKVICTGAGFTRAELSLFANLGIGLQVKSVGYVSDAILFDLYHHAQAFVFPSLYEGFGIPILEAFGNDCPAVISNVSCFPEIGGDAAAYFDPGDHQSMLEVITRVLHDKKYAKELRERGRERVKLFSWQDAARNMNQTFELCKV